MKLGLWHTCPDFDVCHFCCFWDNLQMNQNVWATFSASIRWYSACVSAFQMNVNIRSYVQEAILHKFLHHLEWGDSPFFHHEIAPVHLYDQQHSHSLFFLLLLCHRYFHVVCRHQATSSLHLFLSSQTPLQFLSIFVLPSLWYISLPYVRSWSGSSSLAFSLWYHI